MHYTGTIWRPPYEVLTIPANFVLYTKIYLSNLGYHQLKR